MQMRYACTEVTLGLKEAARSRVKDPWHVQSAMVDGRVTPYKCANVPITNQQYLILSWHSKFKEMKEAMHGTQIKTGGSYITLTTPTNPHIMSKYSG